MNTQQTEPTRHGVLNRRQVLGAAEFGLETNRDYLARGVKMRDERLSR